MNPDDLQETLNQLVGGNAQTQNTEESLRPENYLKKHLLEIQSELDDEIHTRRQIEDTIKMCFCYLGNYTLSFTLIGFGCDLITSLLLSSIVGLIPSGTIITQSKGIQDAPKIPLLVRLSLALITNTLVFFSVAVPHLQSRLEVSQVYQHINVLEYGRSEENLLTKAQENPLIPIALVSLGLGAYIATKKD